MYNGVMKLLIIEDDADILEFIKSGFKAEGYIVDTAISGSQGSYMGRINTYDAIILDYSLPIKNGLEVCAELRASGCSTPILFLTVVSDVKRKVEALQKGADDYLTKPFFFEELRERVKALMRRPQTLSSPVITVGDLTLNTEKRLVERDGEPIYLTKKEYSLLEYLMRNAHMTVSRSMILEHVWDAESDPLSNTVEAHILRLRKKINTGHSYEFIKSIPGRGYTLEM
jgi:DNA-binding response OmpR family regulator